MSVKGTAKRGKKGALNKISNANGETGNSSDIQALEKVFGGGMINYLGESGEMQLHSSQHPGPDAYKDKKVVVTFDIRDTQDGAPSLLHIRTTPPCLLWRLFALHTSHEGYRRRRDV